MKYLIFFTLLTFSLSSIADENLNAQLGESKGAYAKCKEDTADCTTGCEKTCAHLDPAQFEMDFGSGSGNGTAKGKKSASGM